MIHLLADASLRDAIVSGCVRRAPKIDFLSSNDANLAGIPDPEVLALAAAEARILVTSDLKTVPRHFGEFLEAGGTSAGVPLVKQHTPVADVIQALLLVWGASDADERTNRIRRFRSRNGASGSRRTGRVALGPSECERALNRARANWRTREFDARTTDSQPQPASLRSDPDLSEVARNEEVEIAATTPQVVAETREDRRLRNCAERDFA